jgi:hypothetical protein
MNTPIIALIISFCLWVLFLLLSEDNSDRLYYTIIFAPVAIVWTMAVIYL